MEKKKCCIWTTAAVVTLAVIAAIAVILIVLLSRSKTSDGISLDDSISTNATFPDGSFLVPFQSLKSGSPEMAPREVNISMLGQLGVRVDNSSLVAETGRLSYFYIRLPPSVSTRQKRSTTKEASNIGNIGIRFGDADTINVVPLSLASVPLSGLSILGQLQDLSTVYVLQVRMSESMCSGASYGACTLISWRPYMISSDNTTGEGGDFSTSLPVACGSQCDSASDSPCATSSCQACDGQQVAGADTPVTRRYNLGTTLANVSFLYETYVVKDRVIVTYEGNEKLNSGCVGTEGERQTTIYYSGSSQEVRVDVEPNCEGTTGTQWYFQLSCPSPCDKANLPHNGAVLMIGTQEIKDGDTAYITQDAKMPALTAYFCSSNGNGAPVNIQWTLTISPTAGKDPICTDTPYSGYGTKWDISSSFNDNNVQGGDATLSWTDGQQISGSLKFKILGTKLSDTDITTFITQSPALWYAQYIAMQESSLRQFGSDGYPFRSNDNGFGIFQLTQQPKPNCLQIWSWKENVNEGLRRLQGFNNEAYKWMKGQRAQANSEHNGNIFPVPDRVEANCVFKDNSARVIEDAVAIKQYNGAGCGKQIPCCTGCGNYCSWINTVNNQPGYWNFNLLNNQSRNYVNDVCKHVPQL